MADFCTNCGNVFDEDDEPILGEFCSGECCDEHELRLLGCSLSDAREHIRNCTWPKFETAEKEEAKK